MTPALPPATSTASSTERWFWPALVLVAVGGWVLRASPFFRVDGVLGWPLDYDEGVYVSASALLWRGLWPYRDFVFVHPPGAPILLGLFSGWPVAPSQMLVAARVGMTLVGVVNVALVGLVVRRHAGAVGGLLAAGLYATCPQVVFAERGVFLEPLLNLACLGVMMAWTGERPRTVLAGALLGLALTIKSWGVFWLLGAAVTARNRRSALVVGAVAVGVFGVVCAPFLVASGAGFFEQVMAFHLWRPPDGTAERSVRLTEMFLGTNKILTVSLAVGAFGLWRERGRPLVRLLLVAFGAIVLAFLASSAWWSQYNPHLVLTMAMLAGLGCGCSFELLRARWPAGAFTAALVACGLALVPGLRVVIEHRRDRESEQLLRAVAAREAAGATGARACAFEVFDLLRADLLPMTGSGPVLVDSYGQMLLEAVRGGERFPWTTQAFATEAAQRTVRAQLNQCDVVVLGWRGQWQLNEPSRALFEARFEPVRVGVFRLRPGAR